MPASKRPARTDLEEQINHGKYDMLFDSIYLSKFRLSNDVIEPKFYFSFVREFFSLWSLCWLAGTRGVVRLFPAPSSGALPMTGRKPVKTLSLPPAGESVSG